MKKFLKDNKDAIKNSLFLGAMLSFMIFFFAPLEFYFSQKAYFFFSGMEIVPFAAILTVACFMGLAVFMVLLLKINSKIFDIAFAFISALAMTLYIQGNYIIGDYGALDGAEVDWSQYKTQGYISVISFVGIILICLILAWKLKREKYQKLIGVISICLILIQVVTLSTLAISKGGFKKEEQYVSTTEGVNNLSSDNNIIVLMLDTFDSQAMTNILQDDNASEYESILQDFTFYPDTLGTFSWTEMALPCILSGYSYDNSVTYGEYLEYAYGNSVMFNRMDELGWKYNIYTSNIFPPSDKVLRIENCRKVEKTVSSHRGLAKYMYKLVAFRYLPQPLKKYFIFYSEDMKSDLEVVVNDEYKMFSDKNAEFYDNISNINIGTSDSRFTMYHLEGTHPPFYMTKDFTETSTETSIEDEARGMMVLINRFIARLKEIGIYDNSVIFIMADHGYIDYRQCPLLMIKGRNESHPFTVGTEALSFNQLQDIFIESLEGDKTAAQIVETSDRSDEARTYNYCKWSKNMEMTSHSKDIIKFELPAGGKAWEASALYGTGEVLTSGDGE